MGFFKHTVGAVGLAVLVAAAIAGPASAAGLDTTCILPLTKIDSGTVNVAYPDEAAIYWSSGYQALPGTRLRIWGEYPHARYMSFNVYDLGLRPIDAIADYQLQPEVGSSNPFMPGADRTAYPRRYNAFIEFGPKPQHPAANTVYTGSGQNGAPNLNGLFIYRIYTPDRGRDETGGVGLPLVTLESTEERGSPLTAVDCRRAAKPSGAAINDLIAASGAPSPLDAILSPGTDPPTWAKFVNLPTSVLGAAFNNDRGRAIYEALVDPVRQAGGQGGFASNVHNAYMTATIGRAYGQVLVVRGRAPTYPDTRAGVPVMRRDPQVRYWSMCQNELLTQRFIACRTDDQTRIGPDGFYTYVISTAGERPANATAACGVTWIPWGPSPEGVLIYRHMLPSPGFAQSIQRAEFRKEKDTMGDYLPTAKYLPDKAAFEARGCPAR